MIIDLQKFISAERASWSELESSLKKLESNPQSRHGMAGLEDTRRFHYLYERAAADLGRITTFSSEPEIRRYLENLVARAYCEIHESRVATSPLRRASGFNWFLQTFPRTFRRNINAFYLAIAVTAAGVIFGVAATLLDPDSRAVTMPFGHDLLDPAERVAREEAQGPERVAGQHSTFSSFLMTHNTRVAVTTLALGMTWGVGTLVVLFYNGIGLGAIAWDYIAAGQSEFLLGWLMPHGVIEIPAILIAGQAGLLLASALIGRGQRASLGARLRRISPDVVTLIVGVALMLVWAGLIESFLSQYHQPVIPYAAKIAFGSVQLVLLTAYLGWSGRNAAPNEVTPQRFNSSPP